MPREMTDGGEAEKEEWQEASSDSALSSEEIPEEMDLDQAQIVGEVEELREEREKVFLLEDGSFASVGYGTDVHYADENGEWQSIDNRLSLTQGSAYENQAGRVRFSFAKNTNQHFLVKMQQKDTHLYLSLNHAKSSQSLPLGQESVADEELPYREEEPVRSVSAKSSEEDSAGNANGKEPLAEQLEIPHVRSSVIYEEILPDTDLQYIADGSSLKENILVKKPGGSYTYSFTIQMNRLSMVEEEDGTLAFVSTGDGSVFYRIPAMYMVDAEGHQSDAVEYETEVSQNGKKVELTVTADADWMNAPDRCYPVTIDPTLESTSSVTGDAARTVCNQYVTSGHPTTTHNGFGAGFLGYDSAGDKHYRTFVQFTSLPKLPADSVIAQAKFYYANAYYDSYEMDELIIAAKEVTSAWNWKTNLTWNNQPSFSSTTLDYQTLSKSNEGKYVGWNITPLIQSHYEDKNNADAAVSSFALVTYDESVIRTTHCAKTWIIQENSQGFYSDAEPILVIAYRSTRGVESYYSSTTQDLGRAGTASIGDYTSQLTVEKNLVNSRGRVLPFGLNLVYNSVIDTDFTSQGNTLLTRDYSSMRFGKGWKLNVQETITEKTIGSTLYYVWTERSMILKKAVLPEPLRMKTV